MWKSSPKPEREEKKKTDVMHIAGLGFLGLLLETVGFWLLFSWFTSPGRTVDDVRLIVGGVAVVAGFVVLTRWLAAMVKALVK